MSLDELFLYPIATPFFDKKEAKKNVRTRFIATFLTWILLNLIWLYFSHAIAVNEVSKHDREVNGKYVSWSNFF